MATAADARLNSNRNSGFGPAFLTAGVLGPTLLPEGEGVGDSFTESKSRGLEPSLPAAST